jgi:integrase
MRSIKLKPIRRGKRWCLNIPAAIAPEGKRQRLFFKTENDAERVASPLREKLRLGEAAAILAPHQSRIAERAFVLLGELPPEELLAAAAAWAKFKNIEANSVTFAKAVQNYCEARSYRTAKYLGDFRRFPLRFPKIAEKLIARITTAEIDKLLSPLPPVARNSTRDRLGVVFNFAIKRGWAVENPVAKTEKSITAPPPKTTLSAKQIRRLFVKAIRIKPDLVPMLAIQFFAGVRPTEATRILWGDLDFDEGSGVLTVPAPSVKSRIELRAARHIELHPTCRAWIDWAKANVNVEKEPPQNPPMQTKTKRQEEAERKKARLKKHVCSHPETSLRNYLRKIRKAAKIVPWPQDCARHTFASAAFAAKWRDVGGLLNDLGHTKTKTLRDHYLRALRRKPAEAIFAVLPPKKMRKPPKGKSAAN